MFLSNGSGVHRKWLRSPPRRNIFMTSDLGCWASEKFNGLESMLWVIGVAGFDVGVPKILPNHQSLTTRLSLDLEHHWRDLNTKPKRKIDLGCCKRKDCFHGTLISARKQSFQASTLCISCAKMNYSILGNWKDFNITEHRQSQPVHRRPVICTTWRD